MHVSHFCDFYSKGSSLGHTINWLLHGSGEGLVTLGIMMMISVWKNSEEEPGSLISPFLWEPIQYHRPDTVFETASMFIGAHMTSHSHYAHL